MMHIKRFIMDKDWWREPSTIKNHLVEVRRNVIKCRYTGKAISYPMLGPNLVRDLLGIVTAVEMLTRILDMGWINTFDQFDTFRTFRSE